MGRIRRYRTALSRHHRSKGFGIHSPFAFAFVRDVLRERHPYYSYETLKLLRSGVVEAAAAYKRHPRVTSLKNIKMLFRIANRFCPGEILQIGTTYGLTTAGMMLVSGKSRVTLCEPAIDSYPVAAQVLAPFIDGIDHYTELREALSAYEARLADDRGLPPFVLVNAIAGGNSNYPVLKGFLLDIMAKHNEAVVVMRNISRSETVKRLWLECRDAMTAGQSFTNEKVAVIVAKKELNLQHFFLWF